MDSLTAPSSVVVMGRLLGAERLPRAGILRKKSLSCHYPSWNLVLEYLTGTGMGAVSAVVNSAGAKVAIDS